MRSHELYCKIYVDSDKPKNAVMASIRDAVSGTTERRTVSSDTLQIDLVESEDFDDEKRGSGDDRFLFYRYYLDIEPQPGVLRRVYVDSIRGLLQRLEVTLGDAVPACDFEDELDA